jgi:glutamyl-tRNA synthetase
LYARFNYHCGVLGPIVDSVEGVTHALRTTEYNDRDEQYKWIQKALRLKFITKIMTFGKMNFVHTVLSKRKLNWFVEEKLVEGWFDPRFPTIQGCIRRGIDVEGLKRFIISQGASRRIITMEWDKFWANNKDSLEVTANRYMGVSTKETVLVTLTNVAAEITAHTVPLMPQMPEKGSRVMRKFNKVYVDQEDAACFKMGEEVTFLRWGNMTITEIVKNPDGSIVSVNATHDPAATNFSKTKKYTWLAAVPDVVECKVVEFDHLISKPKLDEGDDFKNFVNPVSKTETTAICDPCLRSVNAGAVIQLERKGFFRVDSAYGGPGIPPVLFAIPDGKQTAQQKASKK